MDCINDKICMNEKVGALARAVTLLEQENVQEETINCHETKPAQHAKTDQPGQQHPAIAYRK
jgi:hypothetical protein